MTDLVAIQHWGIVALQLVVATLCGGLIGYQRETHDRPAGFRTHILVCVGSAIYMLVSIQVAGEQWDPGRIAAQVASGMGFLGAGTIIKQGSIVRGLTTAASLWAVAGIGLAAGYGGGALLIALMGTLLVYLALGQFGSLERRMERNHSCRLMLTLSSPRENLDTLRAILATHGITVKNVMIGEEQGNAALVTFEGAITDRDDLNLAIAEILKIDGVIGARWEFQ